MVGWVVDWKIVSLASGTPHRKSIPDFPSGKQCRRSTLGYPGNLLLQAVVVLIANRLQPDCFSFLSGCQQNLTARMTMPIQLCTSLIGFSSCTPQVDLLYTEPYGSV
jgi:hypothetical protein